MPLLIFLIASEAWMMTPTMVVLGVTAAITDDKAMQHYEAEQRAAEETLAEANRPF